MFQKVKTFLNSYILYFFFGFYMSFNKLKNICINYVPHLFTGFSIFSTNLKNICKNYSLHFFIGISILVNLYQHFLISSALKAQQIFSVKHDVEIAELKLLLDQKIAVGTASKPVDAVAAITKYSSFLTNEELYWLLFGIFLIGVGFFLYSNSGPSGGAGGIGSTGAGEGPSVSFPSAPCSGLDGGKLGDGLVGGLGGVGSTMMSSSSVAVDSASCLTESVSVAAGLMASGVAISTLEKSGIASSLLSKLNDMPIGATETQNNQNSTGSVINTPAGEAVLFKDASNNRMQMNFSRNEDGTLCLEDIQIIAEYPGIEFLVIPVDFLAFVASIYTVKKFKSLIFPQNPNVVAYVENGAVIEPIWSLEEFRKLLEDTKDEESVYLMYQFLALMSSIFC
jgi:hypothetical protein